MGLLGKSLLSAGAEELIIEWQQTKTNRAQQFRPSSWTVIREERRPQLLQRVAQIWRAIPAEQPLIAMTTDQFRRLLQLHPQARELGLTAHSFKRGAADVLFEAAARGQLDPRRVALLLKHKDELHDMPASTLRYVQSKENVARALGTQHATRLL
jgi:hypothetical protein